MAAPAAPAAGAGIEGIAGLLLIVAFLLLLGMQQTWRVTIGWIFHKLADLLDKVEISALHTSIRPFGFVSAALRAASDNVYAGLGYAALKLEHGAVWLFHEAERQTKWAGHEIAALAHDTYNGLNDLITREIPAAVRVATRQLTQRLHGIDRTLHRLDVLFHDQLRRLRVGIDRLEHIVTRTLPHAIHAVDARVGRVGARLRPLSRRLSRVEKALGAAAFAAAVSTALARLGLRWLRCGNVKRTGKAVCGMDANLLESLLLDAAALAVAFDLVTFAREVQAVTETVAGEIHKFAN